MSQLHDMLSSFIMLNAQVGIEILKGLKHDDDEVIELLGRIAPNAWSSELLWDLGDERHHLRIYRDTDDIIIQLEYVHKWFTNQLPLDKTNVIRKHLHDVYFGDKTIVNAMLVNSEDRRVYIPTHTDVTFVQILPTLTIEMVSKVTISEEGYKTFVGILSAFSTVITEIDQLS